MDLMQAFTAKYKKAEPPVVAIGDTVTVTKKDGTFLGSGDLYIHSPWNAAAYYGTITEVSVEVNDEVSAGRRLFRLKTSGHSSDYQILKQQREEYYRFVKVVEKHIVQREPRKRIQQTADKRTVRL